jgi:hypothetical protein
VFKFKFFCSQFKYVKVRFALAPLTYLNCSAQPLKKEVQAQGAPVLNTSNFQ